MLPTSSSIASDTQTLFVARIISLAFSIISSVIVARYLGPELKGTIVYVGTTISLLIATFNLGFGAYNTYKSAHDASVTLKLFWNSAFITIFVSIIVLLGLVLFNAFGIVPEDKFLPLMIGFAGFPFLLMGLYAGQLLLGIHQFVPYSLSIIINAVLSFIGIVIVVWLIPDSNTVLIVNSLVPFIVFLWISYHVLKLTKANHKQRTISIHWKLLSEGIGYGVLAYFGAFFQFINARFDNLVVDAIVGAAALGIYSVAVSLGDMLSHFSFTLGTIVFPLAGSLSPDKSAIVTAKSARINILLTTCSAIVLALLSPILIPFIYGDVYSDAFPTLLILLPGIICLSWARIMSQFVAGRGKPQYGTIVSFTSAVITILLDLLLMPHFGIIGAALASTIAYCMSAMLFVIYWRRMANVPILQTIVPRQEDVASLYQQAIKQFHVLKDLVFKRVKA